MRKTMKKIIVLIIMFLITLALSTQVNAQENLKEIKENDKLELQLNLNNMGDTGDIGYIEGIINYDNTIFENIYESDIQLSENLSDFELLDNKFIVKYIPNLSGEESINITLQVRENIKTSTEEIILTNLKAYNGESEIVLTDVIYQVKILENQSSLEFETTETELEQSVDVTNTDNESTVALILGIILILTGIIILIISLRTHNKYKTLIFIISIVVIGTGIIILIIEQTGITNDYDVNGDGNVDEFDTEILRDHLLKDERDINLGDDENNTSEDNTSNGVIQNNNVNNNNNQNNSNNNLDVNNDGNVDLEDLGDLEEELEKEELKSLNAFFTSNQIYYEKNQKITFEIGLENNAGYLLEKLIINGKELSFKYNQYSNLYYIELDGYTNSGVQEIKIDEIVLKNGKTYKINKSMQIEVLKTAPSITGFKIETNISGKEKISFELNNVDSVNVSSANISIDTNGTNILSNYISEGTNEFEIDTKYNTEYTVEIAYEYNRDTDSVENDTDNVVRFSRIYLFRVREDGQIDISENGEDFEEKIEIIKLNKTYIVDKEYMEVTKVSKNEEFYIALEFEIIGNNRPSQITVNGETLKLVEKINGEVFNPSNNSITKTYYARINPVTESGEETYIVTNISTTSGTDLETNNSNNVEILKQKPVVENINTNVTNTEFNIQFEIIDPDNTITSKKIEIRDSNETKIKETPIANSENIDIDISGLLAGEYTYQFVTTYSIEDGIEKTNEVIATGTFNILPTVTITTMSFNKTHIEKEDTVTAAITLTTNKAEEIVGFVIDSKIVNATKNIDNTYTATIELSGNNDGNKSINITKVIYSDNVELTTSYSKDIEVLKSKPIIGDVKILEDFTNETVTLEFNISDTDSAFLNGNINVKNNLEEDILNENIVVGENSITIPVEIGKIYTVSIKNVYKRDVLGTMQYEEELYNHKIALTEEYNFNISDVKTTDIKGVDKIYFENSSEYRVVFTSTNDSTYIPKKLTVNNIEYDVIRIGETNSYYIQTTTPDTSGVHTLNLSQIKLENDHIENINISLQIENLKQVPTANEFNYINLENGNIRIYLDINNKESINHYEVTITDGVNTVYTNNNVSSDSEYIDFTPTISEEYTVIIKANYDLDTNTLTDNQNEYTEILVDEILNIQREYIEIKDAKNVILYKDINGETEKLEKVNINELNETDYFVQVTDSQGNTRYADVIGHSEQNGDLYLTLDIKESITYTNVKKEGTIVRYGGITNGVAQNIDFETLVKMIQENPNSDITLTGDLDASGYTISGTTYINTFSGTLNGNGYTINNLSKPLFNNLDGAIIENITIDKALTSGQAILSISANNTVKISDVHISNSSLTNGGNTGGFIAITNSGSDVTIEYSSITNTYIKGGKRTGGMVGQEHGKLTITNSYIQAEIETSSDAVGGILGEIYGEINFDKIYADVILQNNKNGANGGIVGYGGWANDSITNSISLATGKDTDDGHKVWGSGNYILDNNYSLTESTLVNNNHSEVTNISRDSINKDFILNTLGWDSNIWQIDELTQNGQMPKLKGENETKGEVKPTKDVLIPNYEYVSKLTTFNQEKEIAYHNMNVLMPYLDSETIILYGNKIDNLHVLNTVKIDKIYPLDNTGELVVGLNNQTKDDISKIRIILENNTNLEYTVTFDEVLDVVAIYEIPDLGIKYNYSKLIFNNTNSIYSEILSDVQAMSYETDISTVTPETEDRLYRDYYNEYFVPQLEEKVGNIFETMEEYTLTNDSENIANKIRNDLNENNQLEAIIYVANYFERYYNFDIGIAEDFSDIIFWESDIYSESNTNATKIVSDILGTTEANRSKNSSISLYNAIIKPKYNNQDIKTLLEKYILELDLNSDPDKWFVDQFGGIVVERKLQAEELKDVEYTAWNHLNRRNHLLLVTLSAPEEAQEDMYIIAVPSQIGIGSLNRYQLYLDGDVEAITSHINNYADMILNYYEVSASFTPNATYWLNKTISVQYDTRFNFPEAAPDPGTQELGTTEDPMYKWINEPIGMQMAENGSGAYANGTDTYWVVYSLLWSDFSFSVWTHESAHNQDDEYIYDGNGRRAGSGAEDHADYNNAQNMAEGHFTPNMRYDLPATSDLTVNLKLDRVYGEENIASFYNEMFDTLYVLDYLTAQAFFELTPTEQAKLVTQTFYLDSEGNRYEEASVNTNRTTFVTVTAEQIEAMNLKNMQDLWDNRLVFRTIGTYGNNIYGSSTHYDILWYHPHNDEKIADGATFKRTGYEMLGVGGTNGRFAYHSGMSSNDLQAIRTATGIDTMNWETYKMGRWTEVENELATFDHFDVEAVKDLYVEAMKLDAVNGNRTKSDELRNILYNIIKHDTEDFDKGSGAFSMTYQNEIRTAQELVTAVNNNEWGSYILLNDIDFSGITVDLNTNSYITNNFVGVLDGNGYEITGLEAAIFNESTYAHIKNITLNNIEVDANSEALISNSVNNSLIDNIKVTNINVNLPIFANKIGINIELQETIYEISKTEISTLQDLLEIEASSNPLAKKVEYVLTNNIDLSTLSGNTPIISGEFSGGIDGNEKTITGLTKPLFENLTGRIENINIESGNLTVNRETFGLLALEINSGTVKDVSIQNANISATSYDKIGTLAGFANYAIIENIKLENITLEGNNEVAGLIGKIQNSTIKQIEAINNNITGKLYYVGGIIGRAQWSTIENVYAEGTLTITKTHSGGIVGVLRDNSLLKNVVSNMEILRPQNDDNRAENGGLVGGFENVNASILNAVQIADVASDVYKIVSPTNSAYSKTNNVYELTDKTGINSTGDGNKVHTITEGQLTLDFYANILGLDQNIWDFSTISTLGYPTLK